ncbi:MAG: class I SAM-dependent methyltransferase [Mariprofundaceae bacterium]
MSVKTTPVDINQIERKTLDHYEATAGSFWLGTKDHDVSQNIKAFLQALPKGKTLDILDFGCGPGRDLCAFKHSGHRAIGLDGSKTFCQMAHQHSDCPTLHQKFLSLDLKDGSFDGIFANASLFHVPGIELPRVLSQLHRALRPNGILFSSNPRGNSEGWQGPRYGRYMELETTKVFLEQAGFKIIHHYYRPKDQPREQQLWLAIISQRQDI